MALKRKLGILGGYYVSAHRRRMDFYSWKWRLFIILLAALLALFINDYLQTKYELAVVYQVNPAGALQEVDYTLAQKLFNWFMTGTLFGIVVLAVMYEGEFIIGLFKIVSRFEKQAERQVGTRIGRAFATRPGQAKRKAVKQRKK